MATPIYEPSPSHVAMPFAYTFEVEGVRELKDMPNVVERCADNEADYWSVYRRPVYLNRNAAATVEWVADCGGRDVAEKLRDALAADEKYSKSRV